MRELDNIFWNTLSGPHAHWSAGTDSARRYARGFTPLLGFADATHPDFAAVAPFCDVGEAFFTDGWAGPVPADWKLECETTMFKMVWEAAIPAEDETLDALPLGPEHVPEALALAELTKPGPFGPRTIELGDYVGCFEGGRLVAMAGERLQAGTWREISGVCTHPDFQGRGLARRLMNLLLRRQLRRSERPFLHVTRENEGAHALYRRMGFRDHLESVVRVVARIA